MNINIKTSLDNLLTIVDEFKTDIKENDYIKVMDELKIINENNNHKLYELTFLIFSADYRSTASFCRGLTIIETIQPTIKMVKQRFLLTETEVVELIIKIGRLVNGLNVHSVYGVCSTQTNVISKKVGNFMNELEKGWDRTREYEYNIGDEQVNIQKDIEKEVRLINVKEAPTRRRGQVVRRLAEMSDDESEEKE